MLTPLLFLLLAGDALPTQVQDVEDRFKRRVTPVVEVVEAASPAVVFIQTEGAKLQDFFGRVVQQRFSGAGSGVVILKEGFIITNYHVVKDAKSLVVTFDKRFDEREYKASIVSYVEQEDLALLKIEREHDFPTIPLGTSADLMPGEQVIAIGNPYGQTHTVSVGIISGLHRNVQIPGAGLEFGDLIQTDASINFGNSGGPLININGELIGINSAMNTQAQNIGFAIPVDRVKEVLESQLLSPDLAPTWLGFDVEPGDHLQVARVIPGSPADRAGLQPGDCIVSVEGRPVSKQDDYRLARLGITPEQAIELQVERKGSTRRVRMEGWDKPDGILFERLGLKVERVNAGRSSYVQVREVRPDGPAAHVGLKPGDLLDGVRPIVGRRPQSYRIISREALASLVTQLAPGTEIEVDVLRDLDGNGRFGREELHRGVIALE